MPFRLHAQNALGELNKSEFTESIWLIGDRLIDQPNSEQLFKQVD